MSRLEFPETPAHFPGLDPPSGHAAEKPRGRLLMFLVAAYLAIILPALLLPQLGDQISAARAQRLFGTAPQPFARIEITLDHTKATFIAHTPAYATLLSLLRAGRSDQARAQAGPRPTALRPATPCGEILISQWGIPSRYRLLRSDLNPHYYWIAIPKTTSPGQSLPLFALDPDFSALLHSTAKAAPISNHP